MAFNKIIITKQPEKWIVHRTIEYRNFSNKLLSTNGNRKKINILNRDPLE